MRLSQGTVLAGRYEIIEQIGLGGMAIVYRARDKKLDRSVTVKVMREEYSLDEEFIARFNIEARAAASLTNSNIVNVYDVGLEEDINYIVMEYIDGVTLKELITRRAPFENEETLGVAIQIATALSHAHKNNLIHRDIKPQNIMVTKSGIVKVTDFGIARAATAATTTTSSNTMGSVHYFSPEQARGKYVDFRSDIYSLGIVMFEMATGQIPYDGDSAVTVALKHINEPLPDMKALNPEISESIYKIITKASSKLSTQRYETIDDMIDDLKRALTNESGEFVKIANDFDSPTITIGGEDLEAIRSDSHDYYDGDEEYYDESGDDYYEEDDRGELDKNTERKIIVAAILTAVAIIALISAIGFKIYTGKKPVYTTVPLVLGMNLEDAAREFENSNVITGETVLQESQDFAPGIIMAQTPGAETQVLEGASISLTVSKGVEKVTMPDLVYNYVWDNDKGNDQIGELNQYGFTVDILREYSDTYAVNTVIGQYPAGGTSVEQGISVTLTLSDGVENKSVNIPRITGRSESDAVRILEENNLVPGQITYEFSDDYDDGIVIKQNWEAGDAASEGQIVGFVVSKGPDPASLASETPAPSESTAPVNENKSNTMNISIPVPQKISSGEADAVHLKVTQNDVVLVDREVSMADFPLPVTIQGDDIVLVTVYADGYMEASQQYDLSDGADGGQ